MQIEGKIEINIILLLISQKRIYKEWTSYYKHEQFTNFIVLSLCFAFYWEVNCCIIDRNVPLILFIHVQYRSPMHHFFFLLSSLQFVIKNVLLYDIENGSNCKITTHGHCKISVIIIANTDRIVTVWFNWGMV